jgi:hypothetical protein
VLRLPSRYRPRPGRSAIAITAAVLVTAATLPALAAGASAQVLPLQNGTGFPAGFGSASVTSKVLLINGDQLTVRQLPGGSASTLTSAPDHDPIWPLRIGSTSYEIPVDAVPYLGHGLDASLFNLRSLERLETGGRLPVRLSYTGVAPHVPGVTITSASGGVAAGYLTPASAKAFGQALASQFASAHADGNYGAPGLFSDVSIALAGTSTPAPIRPQFPMHTLTVNATNQWGKADNGDEVLVLNADNLATFGDPNEAFNIFYQGAAKYSLPAGHYWALADFFGNLKNTESQRLVVLPQFTVAGNSTTIHVAAKSATSEVTFTTPRPALTSLIDWTIIRDNAHGPAAVSGTISFFGPIWLSPTKVKPSLGSLQSYTFGQSASTAKKGIPYAYNLDFTGPRGVIPPQHFVAGNGNLATVDERFYSSVKTQGGPSSIGGTIQQLSDSFIITFGSLINVPGQQFQYFSTGPTYLWETSYFDNNGEGQVDAPHTLHSGEDLTENWNQYPLHPQPYRQLLTGSLATYYQQIPSAFRSGNEVYFVPNPFSDNDNALDHTGEVFYSAGYTLKQNGHSIAAGGFNGYARAKLSASPSVISFGLNATQQPNPLALLSPRTYTLWTMPTAPKPKAVVPRSWICVNKAFNPTSHCTVLDLLTLNYEVHGLGLGGVTPAGSQQISVSVGHLQLASPSPIVFAKAQVSWDNGLFWYPAAVSRTSAGNYLVTFNAPAGVDVTLRFSASDAAGGSVAETITDGYATSRNG